MQKSHQLKQFSNKLTESAIKVKYFLFEWKKLKFSLTLVRLLLGCNKCKILE